MPPTPLGLWHPMLGCLAAETSASLSMGQLYPRPCSPVHALFTSLSSDSYLPSSQTPPGTDVMTSFLPLFWTLPLVLPHLMALELTCSEREVKGNKRPGEGGTLALYFNLTCLSHLLDWSLWGKEPCFFTSFHSQLLLKYLTHRGRKVTQ